MALPTIKSATKLNVDENPISQSPNSKQSHNSKNKRVIARQRSRAHSFDDKEKFSTNQSNGDGAPLSVSTSEPPESMPTLLNSNDNGDKTQHCSSDSSVSSTLPVISPRFNSLSWSTDDAMQPSSPMQVVSHVQMSFIRIFAGLKTFLPRNKTVAIAIYFQPIVLVYEIIILDIVETKEICRLYLYQTEIILQLRKRCAMVVQNEKKESSQSLLPPSPLASPQQLQPTIDKKTELRHNRAKKAKKKIRRQTDSQFISKSVNKWQHAVNLIKVQEIKETDENDIDLNTITAETLLNIKALPSMFFTKVILKCLKLNRINGVESRFQLMNELTTTVFSTFSHAPEELKSVLPTIIDAKSLIAQAKSLVVVNVATESLKNSVDSAGEYTSHAHDELKELDVEQTAYTHEDTLNPNVLKWRSLWQSAIQSVIKRNQMSRKIRGNWGHAITLLLKEKREREALEKAASELKKGGGFRKHQVRTRRKGLMENNGGGEFPFSMETMVNYREEMVARRQMKREKSGIDTTKL